MRNISQQPKLVATEVFKQDVFDDVIIMQASSNTVLSEAMKQLKVVMKKKVTFI